MDYYAHITKHDLKIDVLGRTYLGEAIKYERILIPSLDDLARLILAWETGSRFRYVIRDFANIDKLTTHGPSDDSYQYKILEENTL